MTASVICGVEHEPILAEDFRERFGGWLDSENTNQQQARTLGLYPRAGGYAPGNFIGMVWIGDGESRAVLRVDSKFAEMDYIKMFAECAAHPAIGSRVCRCLHFWTEEELIDAPQNSDWTVLTALAYLRELHELCRRHLRRHFLRERKNFCGGAKGKILVGENLRQNIVRARPDRIVCEYQSVGDDILENRILRAALERAARFISRNAKIKSDLSAAELWIRCCRAALRGAPVSQIHRGDFAVARNRGAVAHYRRPLALAKMVLLLFGFNPREEIAPDLQTPPFALDSAELFERYAELKLSAEFDGLFAPRTIPGKDAGDFDVAVRPDFYVPGGDGGLPQIIDAKYKFFNSEKLNNGDFYQVVAYSRHRGVRERIGGGDEAELSLAYPDVGGSDFSVRRECETDAFMNVVRVLRIPCPRK